MSAPRSLSALLDLLEEVKRQHRAGIRPEPGQVEALFDLGATVRGQTQSRAEDDLPPGMLVSLPSPAPSDVLDLLASAARGKAAAMRAAGSPPAAVSALEGLATDIETRIWMAWLRPAESGLITREG